MFSRVAKSRKLQGNPFQLFLGVVTDKRACFGDAQYNSKHITSSFSNSQENELLETAEKLLGEFYNKQTSLVLKYKK